MKRYIAFLRGINVGGQKKVLMKDLKALFQEIGFLNIQTYVQSGNVIFDSMEPEKAEKLELKIERALLANFNFEVIVIIKTHQDLKSIISENPFQPEENSIKRNYLVLLKETPKRKILKNFEPGILVMMNL